MMPTFTFKDLLKVLPYVAAALAALIIWNQKVTIRDLRGTIVNQQQTITDRNVQIAERDALLRKQSERYDALARAAAAAEARNQVLFDQAAKRALGFEQRAHAILAERRQFDDEITECRAAKALLEQELLP